MRRSRNVSNACYTEMPVVKKQRADGSNEEQLPSLRVVTRMDSDETVSMTSSVGGGSSGGHHSLHAMTNRYSVVSTTSTVSMDSMQQSENGAGTRRGSKRISQIFKGFSQFFFGASTQDHHDVAQEEKTPEATEQYQPMDTARDVEDMVLSDSETESTPRSPSPMAEGDSEGTVASSTSSSPQTPAEWIEIDPVQLDRLKMKLLKERRQQWYNNPDAELSLPVLRQIMLEHQRAAFIFRRFTDRPEVNSSSLILLLRLASLRALHFGSAQVLPQQKLELEACCAFYIALKCAENWNSIPTLTNVLRELRGFYPRICADSFREHELNMIKALDWDVHIASPVDFVWSMAETYAPTLGNGMLRKDPIKGIARYAEQILLRSMEDHIIANAPVVELGVALYVRSLAELLVPCDKEAVVKDVTDHLCMTLDVDPVDVAGLMVHLHTRRQSTAHNSGIGVPMAHGARVA
eukprot:Clim_evm115s152 gene=Clim_evmTU115s152